MQQEEDYGTWSGVIRTDQHGQWSNSKEDEVEVWRRLAWNNHDIISVGNSVSCKVEDFTLGSDNDNLI